MAGNLEARLAPPFDPLSRLSCRTDAGWTGTASSRHLRRLPDGRDRGCVQLVRFPADWVLRAPKRLPV